MSIAITPPWPFTAHRTLAEIIEAETLRARIRAGDWRRADQARLRQLELLRWVAGVDEAGIGIAAAGDMRNAAGRR